MTSHRICRCLVVVLEAPYFADRSGALQAEDRREEAGLEPVCEPWLESMEEAGEELAEDAGVEPVGAGMEPVEAGVEPEAGIELSEEAGVEPVEAGVEPGCVVVPHRLRASVCRLGIWRWLLGLLQLG